MSLSKTATCLILSLTFTITSAIAQTDASKFTPENMGSCAALHAILAKLFKQDGDTELSKYSENLLLIFNTNIKYNQEKKGAYSRSFDQGLKIMMNAIQEQASRGSDNDDWAKDYIAICTSMGIRDLRH